jgi:iron complex outermembrane receptor protein
MMHWHAGKHSHKLETLHRAVRGVLLAGGVALAVASPPASNWVRADDAQPHAESSQRSAATEATGTGSIASANGTTDAAGTSSARGASGGTEATGTSSVASASGTIDAAGTSSATGASGATEAAGTSSATSASGTTDAADASDTSNTTDEHKRSRRQLETVIVIAQKTPAEQSREKLDKIPGTVAVIDNADIDKGRDSNLEDVLALQPGIFAQSTSGSEANKISIRGSGLNTFYGGYSLGITYLYDGIPITGPEGTQEDLLSMHAVNSTEVLYGANAFNYSATSLGGAINFTLEDGYTSPGLYVRAEGGSYQYQKEQVSYGGVSGDGTDYYLSVQHNFRSGYQENSANHGNDVVLNFGHEFSSKLDSRLFVRFRREEYIDASPLFLAQVRNNPTANNYEYDRWKPDTTLLGSITTYKFDDGARLEASVGVDYFPLSQGLPNINWQWYQSTDLITALRYLRTDSLFGLTSNTTAIVSNVQSVNSWSQHRILVTPSHPDLYDQNLDNTGSRTTVLSIGNDLQVLEPAWITTGLSATDVVRNIRIAYSVYANTSAFPSNDDYRKWDLAPRLGFRYQIAPGILAFVNGSRSIDPPVTWAYIDQNSATSVFVAPLKDQTANTVEIGARGTAGIFDGSLTFYRSWVQNEILTATLIPGSATVAPLTAWVNGSPDIHQGIEAGLITKLWQSDEGSKLVLRQAYTFNDFYYDHDSVFGHNQLPGLPRWVYQGALRYNGAGGFYAEGNVRHASSYYVDFANSFLTPAYTILGTKIGYEAPQRRWTVFLEGKNLTNRRYVTATGTEYNVHHADSEDYYVGDSRSVYSGFSVRF